MKTVTSGMQTHLGQTLTTLARCWSLVRTDGVGFYFTEHDNDLVIDGNTYKASTGFAGTAVSNNAGMNVDELDVMGFFDDVTIKDEELRAGLFDYAEVKIFFVNWANLTDGKIKMRRGQLGEVIATPQGMFRAELRGLMQRLQQRFGELYSPECRADLGDSRCKLPLDPALRLNSTQYNLGDFVKVVVAGGTGQEVYGNRIFECTQAGQTDAAPPSFNLTIGGTTTEPGAFATNVLTFTALPLNNETVTVGGKVYTFVTTLINIPGYVLLEPPGVGALDQTILNLKNAINLGAGSGTKYAASTQDNVVVNATTATSSTLTVQSDDMSAAANSSVCSETLSNGSWATPTLTGGKDALIWTTRLAWTIAATITSVTDSGSFRVSFPNGGSFASGYFNGGAVKFDSGLNVGRAKETKSWDGVDALTMFLPFPYLPAVGDRLTIYSGCDKRIATCLAKFNNTINFRGEPRLPGRDQILAYPDAGGGGVS